MGTDDPSASNAQSLVNEALHMVEIAHPNGWPYLRDTIAFTTTTASEYPFSTISTTTTIAKVISAKSTAGSTWSPLDVFTPGESDHVYLAAGSTDAPAGYWVEGETFFLSPSPTAGLTVSLRVVVTEPDLVADNEEPICPARFHGAIIAAALVVYYETLQDSARSQAAGQRFDGWIGRMMTATREMGNLPRVRVRSDG